jgi:hypothetical protein
MNINKFFDIMQPNFGDDYVEANNECQLWKICEKFFEQIRPQV